MVEDPGGSSRVEENRREHFKKRVVKMDSVTRTKTSCFCTNVKAVTGHLGRVRLSGAVGTKTMLECIEVAVITACHCLSLLLGFRDVGFFFFLSLCTLACKRCSLDT